MNDNIKYEESGEIRVENPEPIVYPEIVQSVAHLASEYTEYIDYDLPPGNAPLGINFNSSFKAKEQK